MMLEISGAERDELAGLVENAISEVRINVRRTRSPEWREGLHEEEELLKMLLERMTALKDAQTLHPIM